MIKTQTHYKVVAAIMFALTLSLLSGGKVHAASLTVNSTADTQVQDDGDCTLREAINNINNASDTTDGGGGGDCVAGGGTGDTITLPSGTIILTSGLPQLNNNAIIQGAGMGQTVVDGDGLYSGIQSFVADLEVRSLTVQGFLSAGIGVQSGNATLDQVEINGTRAACPSGVNSSCYGVVATNSLAPTTNVNLSNVYIHDINANGTDNVFAVLITTGDNGDAVAGDVVANLENITVTNISGSETVLGIAAAAGLYSLGAGPGTVHADITNATISGIRSTNGGAAGIGFAAVTVQDHTLNVSVKNSTVTDVAGQPSPIIGGSGGVGIASFTGGFVDGLSNTINATVQNTLISNVASGCLSADLSSPVFGTNSTGTFNQSSFGGNVTDSSCSYFTQPTDHNNIANLSPSLGPLANHGGYVPTIALLQGSPAIDSGVAVTGLTTDARGAIRPQGTAYDSGAYESPYSKAVASLASTGQNITLYTLAALATITASLGIVLTRRYKS